MTPEEITNMYQEVSRQIPQQANKGVQEIAQQTAALAPGVAAIGGDGGQGIGAYNYNRLIQPVSQALQNELVLQGRQQALRQGIYDETQAAQERYDEAQRNYRQRQREAAERARREAEEARQAALRAARGGGGFYGGGGGGGGGGGSIATVGGVNVSTTGAAPSGGGARMQQRADGGFNFQDAQGRAISANTYAQIMGIPFVQLVNQMANAGDAGARSVMRGPGVDRDANPAVWRALTW